MSSPTASSSKRRRKRGSNRTNENVSEDIEDAPSTPHRSRILKGATISYRSGVSKHAPTPYSTPFKSRNQSLCRPNIKDANVKKAVSKLKKLLTRQWYVFNVSPLFNLNYNEAFLKRYARRLREKLTARLPNESTLQYEVSYALYPNLQLNDMDDEAIEVTIVRISETGNKSIVYNAILLSWGNDRPLQIDNATFLPILMCQGLKGIIGSVHEELQLLHDCFISSFNVHDEDMRMLTVGILENSSYSETDLIKMNFKLPQTKSGVLDISLPVFVLCNLLTCIQKSASSQANVSETTTFWTEIYSHTYRSFGIDVGQCQLVKVSLPDVAFNHHAIYAKKKEQMYLILCFLMSMDTCLKSVAPQVHEVVLSD